MEAEVASPAVGTGAVSVASAPLTFAWLFVLIVAPAERRLRWWRWLLVGIAAHVVASYVGQGYLCTLIRMGRAPTRLVNARDVGVSYFVFGVTGALSGTSSGRGDPDSERRRCWHWSPTLR
jgi:hypothetical protein